MNKIILSSVLALFLVGCSDQKSEHKQAGNEVKKQQTSTEKVVTQTADTSKVVKKQTVEVKAAAKEVAAPAVEEVPQNIAIVVDGKKLFTKCTGCHGKNGDKKALGKSQVIKGWSVEKVETALQGYKDGTYGGASKNFMKTQVANLSNAEIKALAEYISKL